MASFFKTATVNAASVPSTQTNFPTYIDLSRIGITTLAEAQSVRVYLDAAKTTEVAREIVSATECHAKIPSLTSTTQIWIDADGTSADYAVTDTYGAQAVWSDYRAVYHLNSLSADSTSNGYNLTNKNTVGSATGLMGDAGDWGTANNKALYRAPDPISYTEMGTGYTFDFWVYPTEVTTNTNRILRYILHNGSLERNNQIDITPASKLNVTLYDGTATNITGSTSLTLNVWQMATLVYTGSQIKLYLNGVSDATPVSKTMGGFSRTSFSNFAIGAEMLTSGDTPAIGFNGRIEEGRVSVGELSANTLLTKYNNQSNESSFWGTWTTVGGGGGAPTPLLSLMGVGS